MTRDIKSATSSSVSSSFELQERIREMANPILLAKPPPCVVVDLFCEVLSSLMLTLVMFRVDSSLIGLDYYYSTWYDFCVFFSLLYCTTGLV